MPFFSNVHGKEKAVNEKRNPDPQQQPLFDKQTQNVNTSNPNPNTINGSNTKHPTSYLGSNGTSKNNGNMATTERNVKESMDGHSLLQQMTDGSACGTSI